MSGESTWRLVIMGWRQRIFNSESGFLKAQLSANLATAYQNFNFQTLFSEFAGMRQPIGGNDDRAAKGF